MARWLSLKSSMSCKNESQTDAFEINNLAELRFTLLGLARLQLRVLVFILILFF